VCGLRGLRGLQDAVNKYVSNKASGASESEYAMADPEATQLLWSLLRVMCTHYGARRPVCVIDRWGAMSGTDRPSPSSPSPSFLYVLLHPIAGDLSQQDALKEVRQALLEGINPTDYNAVRPSPPHTPHASLADTNCLTRPLLPTTIRPRPRLAVLCPAQRWKPR
jgi:hypothetical protein